MSCNLFDPYFKQLTFIQLLCQSIPNIYVLLLLLLLLYSGLLQTPRIKFNEYKHTSANMMPPGELQQD